MVDPVYWQVNALREATVKALDLTDAELDEGSSNGPSLRSMTDSGSSETLSSAPPGPAPVGSDG
jgi:hypothetical protein